jgi:hypothetical protein
VPYFVREEFRLADLRALLALLFLFPPSSIAMDDTMLLMKVASQEADSHAAKQKQADARREQIERAGGSLNDPLCPLARPLTSRNLSVEKAHDKSLGEDYGSPYASGFLFRHAGKHVLPTELGRLDSRSPLLACLGRLEHKDRKAKEERAAAKKAEDAAAASSEAPHGAPTPKADPKPKDLTDPKDVGREHITGYLAFAYSYSPGSDAWMPENFIKALQEGHAHKHFHRFNFPSKVHSMHDGTSASTTSFPDFAFSEKDFARVAGDWGPPKPIQASELLYLEPHERAQVAAMLNDNKLRTQKAQEFMTHMNKLREENKKLEAAAAAKRVDEDKEICHTCTVIKPMWTDNRRIYEQIVRPFLNFDSSDSKDPSRGLQNLFNSDPNTRLDNAFGSEYDFVRQCLNPHRPRELKEPSKNPDQMTEAELAYEIHRFMATYDYFRTYNQIRNKYEQAQIELFQHSRMATAPSTVPGKEAKRSFTTSTYVPGMASRFGSTATGTTHYTQHVPYTTAQQLDGFRTGRYHITSNGQTEKAGEVSICNEYIPSAKKVCEELAKAANNPDAGCGPQSNPLKARVDALETQLGAIQDYGSILEAHENLKPGETLGEAVSKGKISPRAKTLLENMVNGDLLPFQAALEESGSPFKLDKYLLEGDRQGADPETLKGIDDVLSRYAKFTYMGQLDAIPNKEFFLSSDDAKKKERLDILFGAHNQHLQGRFFADLKIAEDLGKFDPEKPLPAMGGIRFMGLDQKTGKFTNQQRGRIEDMVRKEAHERATTSAATLAEMNVLGLAMAGKPQETNWEGFKQAAFWTPMTTLNNVLRNTGGVDADPGFIDDIPNFVEESRNRAQAGNGAPPSNASLEVAAGFNSLASSMPPRGPASASPSSDPASDPTAHTITEALTKHDISSLCRQDLRAQSHQSLLDSAWSADMALIPLSFGTYAGIKVATRASLATYRALQGLKNLKGVTRLRAYRNFFRTRNAAEIASGMQHSAHVKMAARLQKAYTALDYAGMGMMPFANFDILSRCFDSMTAKVKTFDASMKRNLTHGDKLAELACQENPMGDLEKTETEYIGCVMGGAFSGMMLPFAYRGLKAMARSQTALRLAENLPPKSRQFMHNRLMAQVRSEMDDRILESDGHFFLKRFFGRKSLEGTPAKQASDEIIKQLDELQRTGRIRVNDPNVKPPMAPRTVDYELDPLHTHLIFNQIMEENPRLLIDPKFRMKLFEHIKNSQGTMRSARASVDALSIDLKTKSLALSRMARNDPNRAKLEQEIESVRQRLKTQRAVADNFRSVPAARKLADEMMRKEELVHAEDFVAFSLRVAAANAGKHPDSLTFDEYFDQVKPFFNALYSQERKGGKSRWYYNLEHYALHPTELGDLLKTLRAGGRSPTGFTANPMDVRMLEADHNALRNTLREVWDNARQRSRNNRGSPPTTAAQGGRHARPPAASADPRAAAASNPSQVARQGDLWQPLLMTGLFGAAGTYGFYKMSEDKTAGHTNAEPTPHKAPANVNVLKERGAVPAAPALIMPAEPAAQQQITSPTPLIMPPVGAPGESASRLVRKAAGPEEPAPAPAPAPVMNPGPQPAGSPEVPMVMPPSGFGDHLQAPTYTPPASNSFRAPPPKKKGVFESIVSGIGSFFGAIAGFFGKLFGG